MLFVMKILRTIIIKSIMKISINIKTQYRNLLNSNQGKRPFIENVHLFSAIWLYD